jgi:hypothetical protein
VRWQRAVLFIAVCAAVSSVHVLGGDYVVMAFLAGYVGRQVADSRWPL